MESELLADKCQWGKTLDLKHLQSKLLKHARREVRAIKSEPGRRRRSRGFSSNFQNKAYSALASDTSMGTETARTLSRRAMMQPRGENYETAKWLAAHDLKPVPKLDKYQMQNLMKMYNMIKVENVNPVMEAFSQIEILRKIMKTAGVKYTREEIGRKFGISLRKKTKPISFRHFVYCVQNINSDYQRVFNVHKDQKNGNGVERHLPLGLIMPACIRKKQLEGVISQGSNYLRRSQSEANDPLRKFRQRVRHLRLSDSEETIGGQPRFKDPRFKDARFKDVTERVMNRRRSGISLNFRGGYGRFVSTEGLSPIMSPTTQADSNTVDPAQRMRWEMLCNKSVDAKSGNKKKIVKVLVQLKKWVSRARHRIIEKKKEQVRKDGTELRYTWQKVLTKVRDRREGEGIHLPHL